MALMLLVACVFLLRALSRKLALARRRGHWLRELDAMNRDFDLQQDPQAYLAALNRLFRAVALKAFPGTHCARLQGEEWVAFLASLMPEFALDRSLSALAHGPYEAAPEFDAAALRESARTWVKLYG